MKKIILSLLCMALCFAMFGSSVFALTYEEYLANYKYLLGDTDDNSSINSTDARYALRSAAKLEQLTDKARKAADINMDGKINSEDARQMLRIAAKLETINIDVTLEKGQDYVMDGFYDRGSSWWFYTANQETSSMISLKRGELPETDRIGMFSEQIYTFSPTEPGEFSVCFKKSYLGKPSSPATYEITYNFTVKDTGISN